LALFVDPSLALHCGLSVAEAFLMESAARRGQDITWSGGISAMPSFRDNAVSVTGLEALARCPFRFYAEKVAGWKPLDALSLSHHLDPMTRGTLLHWLLEQAVKPHLKKKSVGKIAGELLSGEARSLWKLAEQLPVSKPEAAFALAMLPAVFQQAALRDVVKMAIGYFEWARENNAVPQQVEEVFRQPFPSLENLEVIGKVDRIDQLDGAIEVTDFKSAKSPSSDYRRLVKLGWQVQASLYPWLCGQTGATFRYLFLGQFEAEVGDAAGAPEATQLLGELAPILQQGTFLPTSNQVLEELGIERVSPCRYCQCVSACRRFESQSAPRHAALFQQVAPQRVTSIKAAVAKKASGKIEAGPTAGAKPKRGKKSQ
jgi:RecB family exonuclease